MLRLGWLPILQRRRGSESLCHAASLCELVHIRKNFICGAYDRLHETAGVAPAALLGRGEEFFEVTEAFGSVAVQSVGCEDGVDDPGVYIYLTRGSLRQIKSLPEEISGIPIVAQRMGPISVKPETASTTTNRAHLFERNGRVL